MMWAVVPRIFGLNIFLEAGHDADGADQRRHAQRDAGDGDECIERNGPIAALGAQVPEADENLIGEGHRYFSGLNWGKSTTSRMEA